jgi:hypothetical protein
LEATADDADKTDRRHRSKSENQDSGFFWKNLCSLRYLLFKSVPVVVRAKLREDETPGRPTDRMPVLRNAALEKRCPESVRSFVVLIKNEISDEAAKYEHTGKDIEKN